MGKKSILALEREYMYCSLGYVCRLRIIKMLTERGRPGTKATCIV